MTTEQSQPGQVALVTGTSSGIGLETAVGLASAGLTVVATMRDVARDPALGRRAAEVGVTLDVRALDVTDEAQAARTVAQVEADHGSVGVLVGQPFNDAYCAAKFATEGLMESLAPVAARFGVHVCVVEPGAAASEFIANAAPSGEARDQEGDPAYRELYLAYRRRAPKRRSRRLRLPPRWLRSWAGCDGGAAAVPLPDLRGRAGLRRAQAGPTSTAARWPASPRPGWAEPADA